MGKRKPITRNVYLMERISEREWSTILGGRREIKIGVAKDSSERQKQVDRGIKGEIILLDEFKVDVATRIESELHKKYSHCKFRPKGAKRGAGGSEFFKLTNRQIREVKRELGGKERKRTRGSFFWVLVGGSGLIYFYHFFN